MAKLRAIGCIAAVLALSGCGLFRGDGVIRGSGQMASEAREATGFSAVALQGSGEVLLTQGAAESLTIEAEDNILPLVTSRVQDGTLLLGFSQADWRQAIQPTQPIRYILTVRDLASIELSGSGQVDASSLEIADLALLLTGAGEITIADLRAESLTIRLDGTGSLSVGGAVRQQSVRVTGSGNVEGGDLESQAAEVDISGTGDVTVWARERLSVQISGAGSVSYFGLPTVERRDISGAGDINPMGER